MADFKLPLYSARETLGCAHEGMLVTDSRGRVDETNLAAERILELPSLTLKGSDIRRVCAVHNSDDDILTHVTAEGRSLNKPIILQTGTGKRKLVNMSIQQVDTQEVRRYVHVFQDCADLRTVEERL